MGTIGMIASGKFRLSSVPSVMLSLTSSVSSVL